MTEQTGPHPSDEGASGAVPGEAVTSPDDGSQLYPISRSELFLVSINRSLAELERTAASQSTLVHPTLRNAYLSIILADAELSELYTLTEPNIAAIISDRNAPRELRGDLYMFRNELRVQRRMFETMIAILAKTQTLERDYVQKIETYLKYCEDHKIPPKAIRRSRFLLPRYRTSDGFHQRMLKVIDAINPFPQSEVGHAVRRHYRAGAALSLGGSGVLTLDEYPVDLSGGLVKCLTSFYAEVESELQAAHDSVSGHYTF